MGPRWRRAVRRLTLPLHRTRPASSSSYLARLSRAGLAGERRTVGRRQLISRDTVKSIFRPHPLLVLILLVAAAMVFMLNFRSAYHVSRQKATMHSLARVAVATQCYATKHGVAPETASAESVARVLQVFSDEPVDSLDGWNRPWLYLRRSSNSYQLISLGADGVKDGGQLNSPSQDIIVSDGRFTKWPEGLSAHIRHTCDRVEQGQEPSR